MSAVVTLDTREWNKALAQYAAATKKDLAEAVNRQANNLMVTGLQRTRVAEKASIARVEALEWWPKYVAKILAGRKLLKARARAAKRKTAYTTKAQLSRVERSLHYTVDEARRASKAIIRKRLVAVRFVRFFFVAASRALQPFTGSSKKAPGGKTFKGFEARVTPATKEKPEVDFAVEYNFRKRSSRTARRLERILQAAMDYAIPATIRDMERETQRRLSRTARAYSAR